ncbi:MAG: DUF6084 family protein [Candidatus Limnocylindrales bacterium]
MSDLRFSIIGARPEPYAMAPTLMVRLRIVDASGSRIQAVGLKVQVQVEAQRRHYSPAEEGRLFELFAEPSRWGDTLRTLLWTHLSVMVPAFVGETEIDVPVLCSYDFDVAAAKYFHALDDGEIPLLFQFSGSVFAHADGGGLAVDQIAWNQESAFRLPVQAWRDVMNLYFPDSAWLRLRRDSFDALHRFRGQEALRTWEETIDLLLRRAASALPVEGAEKEPDPNAARNAFAALRAATVREVEV